MSSTLENSYSLFGYHNPYAHFLTTVEKPSRYMGGEYFSIQKDWQDPAVVAKVALAFPDLYEIGMGHIGMKILYQEFAKSADLIAERVFAPWVDMEKALRQHQLPLVSLETFRPLHRFDVVGFTLQYEMTYSNILTMLDLGGIPLMASERGAGDPLIIGGGPCSFNPAPLADIFDCFLIGDGEEQFVRLVRQWSELKKAYPGERQRWLEGLAALEGVYLPALASPSTVRKHIQPSLDRLAVPVQAPVPHLTAVFDKFSVEIARGCTQGCRFCQAGMIYRPLRERDKDQVLTQTVRAISLCGYDEVSLASLSTADYSQLDELIASLFEICRDDKTALGMASLRAYGLSEDVLNKIAQLKNISLTFAPEAGSERLRQVINKNITETDILSNARRIFERGWKKMKLYFMIGLPTETDEDLAAIFDLALKVRQVGRECGVKHPMITISVSTFVPKPHTPFQWEAMIPLDEIRRKQEILFQGCKQHNFSFKKHNAKISFLEGVFARGDRRVGELLLRAWRLGVRFDSWDEIFNPNFALWLQAAEEINMVLTDYHQARALDRPLPWSQISCGIDLDFLKRERERAFSLQSTRACGWSEPNRWVCYQCGLECTPSERKTKVSSPQLEVPEVVDQTKLKAGALAFREKRGQNVGRKFRFRYAKLPPINFLSHLDLQKIVGRILKRAQIETLYSEGYGQKQLVAFGPALPLGVISLGEYLDIRSYDDLLAGGEVELLNRLNQVSESGIRFLSAQEIDYRTASIQDSVTSFSYFFPLIAGQNRSSIEKKLSKILETPQIFKAYYSEKKGRLIEEDVRGRITHLEYEERLLDFSASASAVAGVRVDVPVSRGSTVKLKMVEDLLVDSQIILAGAIKVHSSFLCS